MYHHLLCGLSLSKKKTGHPFLKMCVHSISWANTIATVIHTVSKTATPMHMRMHATLAGSQSARHALQNHKYPTVLLENITVCVCGKYHTSSTLIRPNNFALCHSFMSLHATTAAVF